MKKYISILLLMALISCNNNEPNYTNNQDGIKYPAPENISYSILKVYPHDTGSFTQGLIFYNGQMFEGTGDYGSSKLLKVDFNTGKIEKSISLDVKYFGEGICILNDTVYQLTWKEKTVFLYDLNFKKLKEIPINTEGWGITTDGQNLIVSDGSSNLFFYEPGSFKLLRKQGITESGSPSFNLNELEYINGYIYANQWQYNYILKIDPSNGQVVGKADLTEIVNRVMAKDPKADVLNGIAYNADTKKIYVTGKRWPELYEIAFSH